MEQRLSLVTLGVSDYGRARSFYEALGWSATLEVEETAFFQANGCILVLWARHKLAEDMGITDKGARWGGIALAHNVGSREEVHEIIERARSNGRKSPASPQRPSTAATPVRSSTSMAIPGRFAHNPGFGLDDDGNVVLPTPSFQPPEQHGRLGLHPR